MPTTLKFFRRNLPHWLVADRSYFVTLRLHGMLPGLVIKQLQEEREKLGRSNPDSEAVVELQRNQFRKLECFLDLSQEGARWLSFPEVAAMVMKNLDWLRNKGWKIYAAVIMSTHIHLLIRSESGRSAALLDDLAHFKRFAGREANNLLGRSGPFWAREDFDHWIRGREKFEGTIRYILNNPVKAGLVKNWQDWEWHYLDESIRELVESGLRAKPVDPAAAEQGDGADAGPTALRA